MDGVTLIAGPNSPTLAFGLLHNDVDIDSENLTVTSATNPGGGAFSWASDGTFSYTPYLGTSGVRTFTYTVHDLSLIHI